MDGEMRILLRHEGEEQRLAVLVEGRLEEYYQQSAWDPSQAGSIVLGRVERVLPSMGAAFVQIGQKKNGFLPLKEMDSFAQGPHATPLVTGQEVLVQVKKDEVGDKGAFLTRDVMLPGQYCILMPQNRYVGTSSRVKALPQREKALALGRAIGAGETGIIIRHSALTAREQDIRQEATELMAQWKAIQESAACRKPPSVLFQGNSTLEAMVRDYGARYAITVETDAAKALKGMEGAGGTWSEATSPKTVVRSPVEMEALWRGAGVESQLEEALGRVVPLPGGATLVIDEREALTTIDVNSGTFTGAGRDGQSLALEVNLDACRDIARQIRLRNLSGILLVDFIDMETENQRDQVLEVLQAYLTFDRVKSVVHGFTSLGLLEMTRKRTRQSLQGQLTQPCSACKGSGHLPRGQ